MEMDNRESFQELNSNDNAFLVLKEQADKGSADAQIQIGCFYEEGKSVQKSYESAFHYYKLAADQSHAEAQTHLAMLFEAGLGVKQDFEKAFHYFELASMQKCPIAVAQLGKFYAEGKGGVKKSPKEAICYYRMAADLGSLIALKYLAEAYEQGIGVEKSEEKLRHFQRKIFLLIKEEADKGDPESQVTVGSFFENGQGVEKSIESAVHYYQMSVNQNSLRGLLYLGNLYKWGKGVRKSPKNALHYYKLAADQGYPEAQFAIAEYLLENKINEEQAVHYLKMVVQQEQCDPKLLARCAHELGMCFEIGKGVKESIENAIYYYTIASDHGYESAQRHLGLSYLTGEGRLKLKKSTEKAIKYFQLAGAQGCTFSLARIGHLYEKGEGVEQSPEKAFYYYNLGAEKDIKEGRCCCNSIYPLARCYHLGIGTKKSLRNAAYYYKFAAEHNFKPGYYKVGCCYKEMGGDQNGKIAAAYFKMAITGDNSLDPIDAQLFLADFFKTGYGLDKSIGDDFDYYRQSADQGDSNAQYFMGNLYKWGKGVEKSKEDSLKYYKLSADQEYGPALIALADYYSDKVENYEKAYEYYKKAADQGLARAQFGVAQCYRLGLGVRRSVVKAIEYYELALAQNYKKEEILGKIQECRNSQ